MLIALLLPAVQAARNAARRMQCSNNLKQIGIAMHNHHDVHDKLPKGADPKSNESKLGSHNWTATILPFGEQIQLYDSINWDATTVSRDAKDTVVVNGVTVPGNRPVFSEVLVKTYRCPSNGQNPFYQDPGSAGTYANQSSFMFMDYVGLSGATPDPKNRTTKQQAHGIMSGYGVFTMNESRGLEAISDGTSNTYMISELSGQLEVAGTKIYRTGNYFGGWYGMGGDVPFANGDARRVTFANMASGPAVNHWANGIKTIRYKIHHKESDATENADNLRGLHGPYGINLPLSSNHSGGVQAVLGDGSVRFVSDTLDLALLAQLVTIDDGIGSSMP